MVTLSDYFSHLWQNVGVFDIEIDMQVTNSILHLYHQSNSNSFSADHLLQWSRDVEQGRGLQILDMLDEGIL